MEKILARFLCEKNLFANKVFLYISDNCSDEDLELVCQHYQNKGLKLIYHRNKENLGMDGNFVNCIMNAKGDYLLLLGSDDVPDTSFFERIIPVLETNKYGVIHLRNSNDIAYNEHDDFSSFLLDVNAWITFISSNIVSTKFVEEIDFSQYSGTMLSQVPLYLETLVKENKSIVLEGPFFQDGNDSKRNSGYNFFHVFIKNLLEIIKVYVEKEGLKKNDYLEFKRLLFKNLLAGEVNRRLIFNIHNRLDTSGGWNIVWQYYGKYPYTYYYLVKELAKSFGRKL